MRSLHLEYPNVPIAYLTNKNPSPFASEPVQGLAVKAANEGKRIEFSVAPFRTLCMLEIYIAVTGNPKKKTEAVGAVV